MIHFEYSYLLFLLILILPVYLFFTIRARRQATIPYPPAQYQASRFFPRLVFFVWLLLEALLLTLLVVNFAKPYRSSEIVMIEENGIDICLLVDVSSSMQAKDFEPNRLEATKKILKEFVRRSGGHRLSMLVFGKHVFTLSPTTTDHMLLNQLIDGLSLSSIDHYQSGGTALGDAVLSGTDLLKNIKVPGRDQVIILLSDGDNNEGMDPKLATKYALDQRVKIYVIGIGSTKEIEVKPRAEDTEWVFKTRLVDDTLKEIAKTTEGRYFHASDEHALAGIFNEITRLEQTPLNVGRVRQNKSLRTPINYFLGSLFFVTFLMRVLLMRRPLK